MKERMSKRKVGAREILLTFETLLAVGEKR